MDQTHIENALRQARGVLAREAPRTGTYQPPPGSRAAVDVPAILSSLPLPLMAQVVTTFLDSLKPNASWWQRIAIDTVRSLLVVMLEQAARPTA